MRKKHPDMPMIPRQDPKPASGPTPFEERPFSGTLRRLLAAYNADHQRLVMEALTEAGKGMGLPDGAQVDVQRGLFLVPVPPAPKVEPPASAPESPAPAPAA